jgi:hypothetical protein
MGLVFGLVRVAIVMAMVALGGAIFGYGVAQKNYHTDREADKDDKKTG